MASARRVQQGELLSQMCYAPLHDDSMTLLEPCGVTLQSDNSLQSLTGAGSTPAKTSGVVGQRVLMGSKAPDLVATSLSRLPNALSAEYWISKAAQEEDQGDCEVCHSK